MGLAAEVLTWGGVLGGWLFVVFIVANIWNLKKYEDEQKRKGLL